jgi:hypothetical protein
MAITPRSKEEQMNMPEIIRYVCGIVSLEVEGVKIEHSPGETVFILNGDLWKTQVIRVQWYEKPYILIQLCSEQEASDDIINALEEELTGLGLTYNFR